VVFVSSQWMMLVAIVGTFATLIPLMALRQQTPTNYYLLAAFVSLNHCGNSVAFCPLAT